MKRWLLELVRMLVDHPDDVHCVLIQGDTTLIMEIRCHADDIGKVIGKDGKTVGAMRTLLNAMAARQGRKAVVEVVD